jgi:hypothetical protein
MLEVLVLILPRVALVRWKLMTSSSLRRVTIVRMKASGWVWRIRLEMIVVSSREFVRAEGV